MTTSLRFEREELEEFGDIAYTYKAILTIGCDTGRYWVFRFRADQGIDLDQPPECVIFDIGRANRMMNNISPRFIADEIDEAIKGHEDAIFREWAIRRLAILDRQHADIGRERSDIRISLAMEAT